MLSLRDTDNAVGKRLLGRIEEFVIIIIVPSVSV